MSKVNNSGATSYVTPSYASGPQSGLDVDESIIGQGILTLEVIMVLFTDLARAKFAQMEKKAAIAREAQDKVNQLDAQIAELNKEGDKATLSESMKNDMKQNNISLDGKEAKDLSGELNKGEMMKLRAKYESISASAADFVQQNQLKLQQLMQNFNTTITMINSLLSMSAQSNMEIAKSIR
ncbi:EspA family secreted protein [Mycoavidus cysteinexigens]|uniref:EspA family secreted protein n=1 Tax=Mycoavidus cysteinexigens TaxID=1553431 RepID=A0A2Z6ETM4_9BURK|nr:hypothetical protein [Mycoavidus cysteinexigens]BBE08751.1 EspA family secreted protein [Mycoavidus cysteinexigens]GLR01573.1 hypothetical protein GCM10007934_13850 [Mycoavidus cysteinexigens]